MSITPDQLWNSLEIVKLLISVLAPLILAIVGYFISVRLSKIQDERNQRHEANKEIEELERKERKQILERRHTPHIELDIDCTFLGVRKVLTVIDLVVRNTGHVVHQFPSVMLRLRGIKDEPFEYWGRNGGRAYFPHKILEIDLKPDNWNFIYVEPGVSHKIQYTTLIDEKYEYILAHVIFEYKEYWPHSIESVFFVDTPKT